MRKTEGDNMKFQETDGDSFEEMRSINQALSFDALKQEFKTRKIPFAEAQMQTLHMQSTDRLYTEGNHQKRIARTLGSQPVYCGPHSKNHGGTGADYQTGRKPYHTLQSSAVIYF